MADQINANGREWALKNIPAYRTYMDTMSFGGKRFEPAQFEHYSQQVGVQATDLDEVFEITNLWNRPEQILFKNQPRSVSVGDIIENTETGEFFMVDMFGFTQVTPA
jgi:hypothetical protein